MESSKLNQFFSEAEQKAIQADALIAQLKATLIQQTAQVEFIAAELQAKWVEVEGFKSKFANLWNPSVDYSFIEDALLVERLENDCRKMAISRSGFRGSSRSDDFADYCGYVQLQIEGCFYYYYHTISNGSISEYNSRGSRISGAAGQSFSTQTEFKYGSFFYLSNIEFSLHDRHSYFYFSLRSLMHFRNTQLFHRSTGTNDKLSEGAKASLQRLIASQDFAKVESVLHFVVDLIRKTLVERKATEQETKANEEVKAGEDLGTYAEELKPDLLESGTMEMVTPKPELISLPQTTNNA